VEACRGRPRQLLLHAFLFELRHALVHPASPVLEHVVHQHGQVASHRLGGRRPATEPLDRLPMAVRRHGHKMTSVMLTDGRQGAKPMPAIAGRLGPV
jgi:hypothetical protein